MTVPSKHGIYFVGLGATTLGGITRQSIATNTEIKGEASSGEVYRRWLALYSQRIAPTFTTHSIAAALDVCGAAGADLAAMTGGFCLYAQKHADGATRTAGANHRKYKSVKGILAPRRLTCDHRGDATIEYEAVVTYDGVNDPLVISDSESLPAVVADAGRWTIGPATLGGISFTGKRQVQIDFGLDVVPESADSDYWDTFASIRAINSEITFRGIDAQWLKSTAIPLTGLACTHANTAIYLKKRAAGSTFVANGTAQHIKFTACGVAFCSQALDGTLENASECSITLPCYYDGTNTPIIANTASAIT
jgi:hypothetical protein